MKIKKIAITAIAVFFTVIGMSQKYMTRTGTISFYSSTPIENIEATNNQVSSVINGETGDIVFSLLMKAFSFEKALMQEHFNEKYVESDKYPKSTFKGKIKNFEKLTITDKEQEVEVTGSLTIHGKTKEITTKATLSKVDGKLKLKGNFSIKLKDFGISIPSATKENLSETIEIKFNMEYDKV